jgi:hypothetical protein
MALALLGFPEPPTDDPLPMVLLGHSLPASRGHVDWMIARSPTDGPLASWRLSAWPRAHAGAQRLESAPDHDRGWLTREGVLSRHRGTVHRLDSGLLIGWTSVETGATLEVIWDTMGAQTLLLSSVSGVWSLALADR